MSIKLKELKKIITSPVILSLLIIFISFNFSIIYESSHFSGELNVLNNIVNKFGYKINNESMINFKKYYDSNLKKMNKITYKKASKVYNSASEFFNNHEDISNVYTKGDITFFNNLRIEEEYYYAAMNIDSVYKEIDPMQIAEGEIKQYNLRGEAAETVRSEYRNFNKRFNELVKNGENKNLFFMGPVYRMHSLLFHSLFKSFIFEIIILSVLITAYSVNYEFDNGTQVLAYSTKRGRNLIKDKFLVSIFSNLVVATIIIGTGLGVYFTTFDYKKLLKVPISSYFIGEFSKPYMSKWNMTFIQYLILGISLIYILTLIFTGIAFFIARCVKNSYIVFFIFAIVYASALVIPKFIPTNSNAVFIGAFTPFVLSMNSFIWFMEAGAFYTFKYYELITAFIWTSITSVGSICCIKDFKKVDIY
jgi:hypothetical protein